MADSTNKAPSKSTQQKVSNGFTTDVEGLGSNYYAEGPIPDYSQVIGGFNITAYKFADGSNGIALYNGKAAFHIDNNNNITLAAGPPGQSGCGGKMIENVQSKLTKAKSVTIEVTGRDDGGTVDKKQNADGNVEESTLPAYSLKVYGPCYIEAIGGDVAIKGDNITLNASSTLNLKSNKDINIQAGENGGKISMYGGTFDLNTAFFNKKLSGGEYSDGSGEFAVEQKKPGASVNIDTPGSVKYTVNGDYTVGVTGDYKLGVTGNFSTSVTKDYALEVKGKYGEVITGKMKTEVQGVDGKPASAQQENYVIEVGPNAKKSNAGLKISSDSKVEFANKEGGYKMEVGKQLATLELDTKKFSATTGAKMGAIELDEKQAVMKFGETAKVSVSPKESILENSKSSKITVKPDGVDIVGPKIFLN